MTILKSSNLYRRGLSSRAIGLETNTDKILFSIAVVLTVILFGIILWFWKQKRRSNKVHITEIITGTKTSNQSSSKQSESVAYPTITVVTKSGSQDQESVAESDVSSMWDTQSQKHDKSYFKVAQLRKEVEDFLARSRDRENVKENGIDTEFDLNSCKSDHGDSTVGSTVRSTVGTLDQEFTPPTRKLQRDYHVYSKSDVQAFDSRDDQCEAARSV